METRLAWKLVSGHSAASSAEIKAFPWRPPSTLGLGEGSLAWGTGPHGVQKSRCRVLAPVTAQGTP